MRQSDWAALLFTGRRRHISSGRLAGNAANNCGDLQRIYTDSNESPAGAAANNGRHRPETPPRQNKVQRRSYIIARPW